MRRSKVALLTAVLGLTEAGFGKGGDGVWTHPTMGRMEFEDNVLANPDSNAELSIKADAWRRLGFDVKEVTWAPAIGADREARATFPGLSTTSTGGSDNSFASYKTGEIPRAPQWRGGNRGGWPTPPDFDRLVNIIATDLNRGARTQAVIQANRTMAQDVAVINLYWKLNAVAFVNGLTGPRTTDPEGADWWNLHEWELK